MPANKPNKRVAIVGSGISGLAAAYTLRDKCHLTLFEQNEHFGGHAHSVTVSHAGASHSVDIAFMVFNQRNYPRFCALLGELGIRGKDTAMSFSVVHEAHGITYNGGSLSGLFADKSNLLRGRFWRFLGEILRFNRLCKKTLQQQNSHCQSVLADFLQQHKFTRTFSETYVLPMGASIWSCTTEEFANAPTRFVLEFFNNHGLLDLTNRPQWQVIPGGSQCYVKALMNRLPHLTRRPVAVTAITPDGKITTADKQSNDEQFDAVVVATHAPQALALLTAPTQQQRDILGAFCYTQTTAVLHTDKRLLPAPAAAHAAWNYRISGAADNHHACPTYSLSQLQHVPGDTPLLLTLNPPPNLPDSNTVLGSFDFSHPLPDINALNARRRFSELHQHGTLYFCGAYWGNGFHEDGVVSGEGAAHQLLTHLAER